MERQATQQTKLIKIIVLLLSLLLFALILTGIIQTLVHKNMLKTQQGLDAKNQQVEQQIDAMEEDSDFFGDDDIIIVG